MVQVKFIVLLVCALTLTQAFEAEGTLLSMSLNEISNLNLGDVNCQNTSQQQFVQLEQNLESWADIIDHKDDIQKDINTLKQLEVILLQVKKQTQKKKIAPQQLKQINQVVTKKIKSLVLPQTASKIGQAHCDEIERQLERLSSDNESERSECCDALLKLATFLIRQLSSMNQQCHQNPVTVIKIKGQIKELHIIQGGCGGGQTIDIPMGGGSDEKCDKPETPTKPTDPTNPETPTDDPVPDPGKEEETTDEETTVEETTTEEGETTPPGPDAEEEGETTPPGPDAEEEGETTPPGPDAEEEGETTPPGPDAEEEGETTPPGPDAEEEGETTPPGPDAEEEGETTGPDAEEEGETTPPGPDAEEEGETTPPGPDAEEEGEATSPSAEEELHEPAEEEEESFGGDEKNNTKGPGDIPEDGEEEGALPEEEFSPEDGPQAEEEGTATEEGTPAGEEEGTPAGPGEEEGTPAGPGEEDQEETVSAEEGLPEGEEESEFPGDIPKNKNGTTTLPDLPEGEEGAEEGVEGGEEGEESVDQPAGEEAGEEAGEDAGEEAGEDAGEEAGEDAGEEAGEDAGEEAGEEEEGWVPGDIPKGKNGTTTLPDLPEGEEGAEEEGEDVGEEGGEESGEEDGEVPGEETEETPDQPEEQEEKCQETVEITATNAADIMCALGQYLSQLAHGGSPSDSPNAKKVCFCLKYEPDNADPSLLQLTQKVSKKQRKEQDGILKALIPNRRI